MVHSDLDLSCFLILIYSIKEVFIMDIKQENLISSVGLRFITGRKLQLQTIADHIGITLSDCAVVLMFLILILFVFVQIVEAFEKSTAWLNQDLCFGIIYKMSYISFIVLEVYRHTEFQKLYGKKKAFVHNGKIYNTIRLKHIGVPILLSIVSRFSYSYYRINTKFYQIGQNNEGEILIRCPECGQCYSLEDFVNFIKPALTEKNIFRRNNFPDHCQFCKGKVIVLCH